jgi:hypothetical protein
MVEPAHHCLSISAQCRLLRISRSSYYYAPVPETDKTLALMTVIDATFLDCPWYGSRQMVRHLRRAGHEVGRRRVRRLMAKMGLTPIYQRPRTSDPHLKLERRVSHDGLVSIGGNYYSVPDRTRRVVEVHQLPDQIRILDEGRLVATHPILEGRRQYRVDTLPIAKAPAPGQRATRPMTPSSLAGSATVSPIARWPSTRPSESASLHGGRP